jgi:hypothetical protein
MKNGTTLIELEHQIAFFESKQRADALALKEQFNITFEQLRPINLIKNTFKDLTARSDFKEGFFNSTIGIGLGFLTKKLLVGSSHNPLKNILATVLQVGITTVAAKNGEGIKTGISKLVSLFKKGSSQREF